MTGYKFIPLSPILELRLSILEEEVEVEGEVGTVLALCNMLLTKLDLDESGI